jgi:hypothetical protein
MGIRETRKKLQRTVDYVAAVNPAKMALHELTLLKQTVDDQVSRLSARIDEMRNSDAPDTEAPQQTVAEAAAEGFGTIYSTVYPDVDAG